jgi:photosystem II stability/assembly factor-like uncharacterized protein
MTLRPLLAPLAVLWTAALVVPVASPQQPAATDDAALFNANAARSIGPVNPGGRVTDVAVVESDPSTMYVAAATGGVWKTTDDGQTWRPVFDQAGSLCIGDVTVSQSNPDVVWVGTGEGNILRSVSHGDGVYKSTDGGKSWKNMGLRDSRHTGRIVIHPKNPDIVYVGALGHAWAPNTERGLFKTTDGGRTWDKVLYLDESTGVIDVAMDPSEPDTLYACAYTFRRDAYSGTSPRVEWGPKSGLYKTTDGGKSWEKMTEGLPDRPFGRCGIDVYRKDPKVLFAIVQTDKSGKGGGQGLDTGGIFRSEDKGRTWNRVTDFFPPLAFYFGQIRVDPNDEQHVYVLAVQVHSSTDGGKNFTGSKGVHADNHALWINPKNSEHLVLGNDGGLYVSKNRGKLWQHITSNLVIGQFYAIGVDLQKPYRVYGGMQDTGSWGGPTAKPGSAGVLPADWKSVFGGDGFYCQVDSSDPDIVYCEMQYGGLRRISLSGKKDVSKSIKPSAAKGEQQYRFNWNSPILISPHAPKTIYFGGNFLFKSTDRGDTWDKVSPDLTRGDKKEDTGHTITTIAESPRKQGLLWVGTDDGRLHVTRNGGKEWTEVTANIPGLATDGGWVTRVECSHHAEGTCYITLDRHRDDDLRPYVYKTTNYGETWHAIRGDLPNPGNVHVIRESSRNPNLLFVGTEYGLFGTLDGGRTWHHLKNGIPPKVLVHDLVIHPRERELVVGTHGRGIYVIDVAALEEMTEAARAEPLYLCTVRPTVAWKEPKDEAKDPPTFRGPNPPYGAVIDFLQTDVGEPVSVVILDKDGKTVAKLTGGQNIGLHRVVWNLRADDSGQLVATGEYIVRVARGGRKVEKKVVVEAEQ